MDFLKFNNFTYKHEFENNHLNDESVIVINLVHRFYFEICKFFIYLRIEADEFFKKINYSPKEEIKYEKLLTDEGKLLYEEYTLTGSPYGLGTLYFDNGNIYQEGVFDFKGIKYGKEYYYSGQVKFEGEWSITHGYGSNAPRCGNVYDENGKLTFSGKFVIKKGGVGWPMIKYPKGYCNNEKNRPKIQYIRFK